MKRLNPAKQYLPKFKRMGNGVAKLRGLLQASGLVSGTVPEAHGAVELPPKSAPMGAIWPAEWPSPWLLMHRKMPSPY